MTAALRLYTGPLSMFGMKAEIALAEKGIAFERIEVPFENARGYDPRDPEVLRINPKRQVPVLVHGAVEVFDSTQIFEYLEDAFPKPALWPSTPADRAVARLLEHRSDEVFFPHVFRLMELQDKLDTPEAATIVRDIEAAATPFETCLAQRDYLAGEYTYADIALFMAQVFAERMGAPLTASTPRLLDWRKRVGERDAVQPVAARLVDYLKRTNRQIPAFLLDLSTFKRDHK